VLRKDLRLRKTQEPDTGNTIVGSVRGYGIEVAYPFPGHAPFKIIKSGFFMSKNCQTQKQNFPWSGCGANRDLFGCRLSLYPLDDHYP
jgi:hypothetical protein